MQKVLFMILLAAAALLGGCSADTPTQAASTADDAVASMVAVTLGHESMGLSAVVTDLITAGRGRALRRATDATSISQLVVTRNDSIAEPLTRSQLYQLACERQSANNYSSWQIEYALRFSQLGGGSETVPFAGPRSADVAVSGTFRNGLLTARGDAHGTINFDGASAGDERSMRGEYRWEGEATVSNTRYDNVAITLSWNRLRLPDHPTGAAGFLRGHCDVTVRAMGPDGVISRNGDVEYTGDGNAIVSVGGRRYLVDVHAGETVRGL
ncbi:MAG TPA: hypothetical protein VHI13_15585 [Candidatus Kapabacteria bacterium]|nr:hypothetical protein [Candidatus Kapabacteria bacterium]